MTDGRRAPWFVFAAAIVFFSVGAASRGLWHADEHRIAEVAREMAAPGGDWIVPHLGGEVYAHKPPLVPWIVALCHGALGLDLAFAAKVPSILGAALAALAAFLIARRLYGGPAAIAAAAVLATAAEFDWICRRAQYDPLLTGFTTLALWFFVRSHFPGPGAGRATPWRDALLGWLSLGLAVMVKGPVAFVFTLLPFLVFTAISAEWRSFATPRAVAALLVFVPASLWLAFAIDRGGFEYAKDLVLGRLAAQTGGDDSKDEAVSYYLVALPKGFLPWTLLAPAAILATTRWRRAGERRADVFALSWVAAPLVMMSLIPVKRDLYLLPLYPGAALCVGKLAVVAEERLRHAAFAVPRFALGGLSLAAGAGAIVVASLVLLDGDGFLVERISWWTAVRGGQSGAAPLLAALCGVVLVLVGWRSLRDAPIRAFGHVQGAAVAGTLAFAGIVLPSADPAKSPRSFYEKVAARAGDAPVALYGVDDFAGHWAMRRDVLPYLDTQAAAARFLAAASGPAFVVVERTTLERKGMPAGAAIVLEERLPLEKDLLLLARE